MAQLRNNDPRKRFGAAVRAYRLGRGISQEKLAQIAGIHRNYAGAVERGERNVAIVNMVRIAKALGVSLSKLVEGVDGAAEAPGGPARHPSRAAR